MIPYFCCSGPGSRSFEVGIFLLFILIQIVELGVFNKNKSHRRIILWKTVIIKFCIDGACAVCSEPSRKYLSLFVGRFLI